MSLHSRVYLPLAILAFALFSCKTTYNLGDCSFLIKPTDGKLETKDAKVDYLSPALSGLIPRSFVPRKSGRIYVSFSKQDEGYSLNINTFFSSAVDDLERIKPENKLVLTLDDSVKVELSPREERMSNEVPEAVYLIDGGTLDKIIAAQKVLFVFQYTSLNKKDRSKSILINKKYLSAIQQRAICIRKN